MSEPKYTYIDEGYTLTLSDGASVRITTYEDNSVQIDITFSDGYEMTIYGPEGITIFAPEDEHRLGRMITESIANKLSSGESVEI